MATGSMLSLMRWMRNEIAIATGNWMKKRKMARMKERETYSNRIATFIPAAEIILEMNMKEMMKEERRETMAISFLKRAPIKYAVDATAMAAMNAVSKRLPTPSNSRGMNGMVAREAKNIFLLATSIHIAIFLIPIAIIFILFWM